MKSLKRNTCFRIFAYVAISVAVILFFGRNCKMRMAAYPCMYKEYLSGVIVMAMACLCLFVIIPRILSGHSIRKNMLFLLSVIFAATLAEMALVFPQVFALLLRQFSKDKAIFYFSVDSLFVLFRNTSIISFFFLYKLLRKEKSEKNQLLRLSVIQHRELALTDNRKVFKAPIDTIVFCEQVQNYARFHLSDGGIGYLHCTLSEITALLDDFGVRVSRSVYVMLDKILSYDGTVIIVKGKEVITFKVTDSYRETVSARMSQLDNVRQNPVPAVASDKSVTVGASNQQQISIQTFIRENPRCSEKNIMQHTGLSRSSVAKYIAKLKQQGLIRHVGSNKTGGYVAAEGEMG